MSTKTFTYQRVEVSRRVADLSALTFEVNAKLTTTNSVLLFHANQITQELGYRSVFSSTDIVECLNKLYTILFDNNILSIEDFVGDYNEFEEGIYNRQVESYNDFIQKLK